mgnify:CR=1 FL=1
MMQDEGESKPFGFTSDAAEEGKEEEGDSSDDDDYDCQVSNFDVSNILVRTFHRGWHDKVPSDEDWRVLSL